MFVDECVCVWVSVSVVWCGCLCVCVRVSAYVCAYACGGGGGGACSEKAQMSSPGGNNLNSFSSAPLQICLRVHFYLFGGLPFLLRFS